MIRGFVFPGVALRTTPGYDLAPLQGDRASADAIIEQSWRVRRGAAGRREVAGSGGTGYIRGCVDAAFRTYGAPETDL